MAVHHLDPAFNALELDNPETIEATAPWVDDEVASKPGLFLKAGMVVEVEFLGRAVAVPIAAEQVEPIFD